LANNPFTDYSSRKIISEGQANIFAVRPAVSDLLYVEQKKMDQITNNNRDRQIILYEVELKK
jgi:hypothetical protein